MTPWPDKAEDGSIHGHRSPTVRPGFESRRKFLELYSIMAWLSSGRTNVELIENMKSSGLIHSPRVAAVENTTYPNVHLPMRIRLITAVFHYLSPKSLVVGIDHIQGLVSQSIRNLANDGVQVLDKHKIEGGGVLMLCGDGRKGSKEYAPFTVIHVGAAAPEYPQELVDQLAKPGRMFIPVGRGSQGTSFFRGFEVRFLIGESDVWQIDKSVNGDVTKKKLFGVMASVI
ncbi:protein-L-isoaspartate O-methyltransferase [Cryptococcus deuterogattii 2001/935-1]|nr:protein-L-isoaspartate O-methyltransferase [Cryptococcus deuterogattii 2001/935-1]